MSKPTKPKKAAQVVFSNDIVPTGSFMGNDSWHNFAKLGDEYLQAAKFANEGFKEPKYVGGLKEGTFEIWVRFGFV